MLGPLLFLLALHPLHTTHTTISAGPGSACTVEIRAFTDDLHAALRRRGGDSSDSGIAQYVRSTVTLTDRSGQPAALQWIGQTPDGDVTRLRLSCILPAAIDAMTLRQAMQLELYTDQVNVVQLRAGKRRLTLLFVPGDNAKPLT